ncbi:hypothetical protein NQ117_08390 [Paenibacillus sp. SC116]|uniref:hypothetical protein n=1 Tax=Paenibacillus sp. SC116 TaxID=2968986 RepID=UPI00215A7331|nr:hypothetical protein [Paenibacillus sp. SC116]MCR8843703.1 hypothetical protein [Paenibacillus sp. SC116]
MTQLKKAQHSVYKFSIDILIQGPSNAAAMEKLLHLLNRDADVLDMKIQSGADIGSLLDLMELMQQHNLAAPPFGSSSTGQKLFKPTPHSNAFEKQGIEGNKKKTSPTTEQAPSQQQEQPSPPSLMEQINDHIKKQRLIRLHINKGHGVKLSIPCRILNFDPDSQLMNVYHVDEKQVYAYYINEIEEMII